VAFSILKRAIQLVIAMRMDETDSPYKLPKAGMVETVIPVFCWAAELN
tara:strand:+ start:2037 stop:2180 length:144 start_codon:yes stop_codon:yes gene_type:complete